MATDAQRKKAEALVSELDERLVAMSEGQEVEIYAEFVEIAVGHFESSVDAAKDDIRVRDAEKDG